MIDIENKRDPFPTCTNIRYDASNEVLIVDINDLKQTKNCQGFVVIYTNSIPIHEERFMDFRKIPRCYSIKYIPKGKNDIIEVKLTLEKKIAKCKSILNKDNINNGLSWQEWEQVIKKINNAP